MQRKILLTLGVLFLMGVGIFLRLSNLTVDSLYLDDEGAFITDARAFAESPLGIPGIFAKPLQSLFLALGLLVSGDQIIAVQRWQAILAALWIPVCFLLTHRLTANATVAFLAAFFTTFDPWIYLYARHLLAEPLAGLLWMLTLFFLLRKPLRFQDVVASGCLMGLAILSTRRTILFVLPTLIFLLWNQIGSWRPRLERACFWLGMGLLPLLGYNFWYEHWFEKWPYPYVSYFHQLVAQLSHHTHTFQFHTGAWPTYPFLINYYEGILFGLFLILGLFAVVREGSKTTIFKFFSSTYLVLILFFGLASTAYARVWAPLLFWHSILAALAISAMGAWLSKRLPVLRWVGMGILCASLLCLWVPKIFSIQKVSVPYSQALAWIKQNHPSGLRRLPPSHLLLWQRIMTLEGHYLPFQIPSRVYRPAESFFIIIDYFFLATKESELKSISLTTLATLDVFHQCEPAYSLPCGNPKEFWSHFVWEHNVHFKDSFHFLKAANLDKLSCIEIYDLKTCPVEYLNGNLLFKKQVKN